MATVTPTRPPVFNVPNQLTAARFLLAVVLFILIALENYWIECLAVFAVAAFTDWLDGYLARKQGISSTLGRILDPLVDKVLICGAYVFLLPIKDSGLVPWMVTVVVARELVITSLRSFLENRGANFGADWLGKLKMGLQCAALLAIFIHLAIRTGDSGALADFFAAVRTGLIYAMLGATVMSGLQYLWRATVLLRVERGGSSWPG
jgi:CDP-diacylglycerol--glycerol-3-phosphate 3-phosphatidyltransferase